MLRYSDAEDFSKKGLVALGYSPMPVFSPGPATDTIVQKISPGAIVFLTVGGGAGLSSEGLFDQPFLTVRAVSKQFDYPGGEKMAEDLDNLYLAVDSNAMMGESLILPVTRSGGAPQLVQMDAANRYHFQCSYIVETQMMNVRVQ